jgi:hypothetical protein
VPNCSPLRAICLIGFLQARYPLLTHVVGLSVPSARLGMYFNTSATCSTALQRAACWSSVRRFAILLQSVQQCKQADLNKSSAALAVAAVFKLLKNSCRQSLSYYRVYLSKLALLFGKALTAPWHCTWCFSPVCIACNFSQMLMLAYKRVYRTHYSTAVL